MVKRVKEITLKNASDREILGESLRRRGIEPNENNLKKWRLMLMDKETINALKGRMSYVRQQGPKIDIK